MIWAGVATAQTADITILGEVHDNPAHHAVQAERVAAIGPKALVFEMLSPEQAAAAVGVSRADAAALGAALGWDGTGWPDFSLYAPIFAAAPDAVIYGSAVPHDAMVAAMKDGAGAVFGDEAAIYGLAPLDPADQAVREAEQADAHCGALPPEMLPGMVEVQRLRDASFARTALAALDQTGGPVVVITGDGHARTDRAVPFYIRAARPEVTVWSLGQLEGPPEGDEPYDEVLVSPPPPDRPDPCLAFK